jgi:hypothetical protein
MIMISLAAADAGWGAVTVDAFASESNTRVPRFWSRFFEPGSETLDALCVLDWSRSVCPACGLTHREVVTWWSMRSRPRSLCALLWRRPARTGPFASSLFPLPSWPRTGT